MPGRLHKKPTRQKLRLKHLLADSEVPPQKKHTVDQLVQMR